MFMKSLNENLFENLSVTELEERLEMTALSLAADGAHACSSIDCIQHAITRGEQLQIEQAVASGEITATQAQQYLSGNAASVSEVATKLQFTK
jgi:hypothetical protein